MAFIRDGYVVPGTNKVGKAGYVKPGSGRLSYLVKYDSKFGCYICIGGKGNITLPLKYAGKKVKLKVEILK